MASRFPKVAVVLLNWQGWRDTLACLQSLDGLTYSNSTTVVVDNGSADDSVEQITAARPDVNLIQTGRNLGFSGGCNAGIRAALSSEADYVWLLNNDACASSDALSHMVDVAESDEGIGAVGSVIRDMHDKGAVQAWGGGKIGMWTGRTRHLTRPGRIDYITGASMLLRASVLTEVGLLDESFFLYWDDCDICLRVRDAGYRLEVAEGSTVFHKESATVGKGTAFQDRVFNETAVRFYRKHAKVPIVPIAVGVLGRCLKRLLRFEPGRAAIVLVGAFRGLSDASLTASLAHLPRRQ